MSKSESAYAIAKILYCEGNSTSDDNILQIQKQMKYLKIKWAVLKWKWLVNADQSH